MPTSFLLLAIRGRDIDISCSVYYKSFSSYLSPVAGSLNNHLKPVVTTKPFLAIPIVLSSPETSLVSLLYTSCDCNKAVFIKTHSINKENDSRRSKKDSSVHLFIQTVQARTYPERFKWTSSSFMVYFRACAAYLFTGFVLF